MGGLCMIPLLCIVLLLLTDDDSLLLNGDVPRKGSGVSRGDERKPIKSWWWFNVLLLRPWLRHSCCCCSWRWSNDTAGAEEAKGSWRNDRWSMLDGEKLIIWSAVFLLGNGKLGGVLAIILLLLLLLLLLPPPPPPLPPPMPVLVALVPYGDIVCNNAHFVPNLQLPLTKYLQTADSEERSELWEKVQFAPAVQVPCL